MAEKQVHSGTQIAILDIGDYITGDYFAVETLAVTATADGTFVFELGNVSVTITTGTSQMHFIIPVNRRLNYVKLTSGPAGAQVIVFLEQKK